MWRIRLDTSARRLALEVRDPDLLLAHFYTFDTSTYSLKQLPLQQGQAWWQGLEDAQNNFLYLHGYGDRKLGQHKGITAITADTLSKAWEEADLTFYGITGDGLLAYPVATPEATFFLLQFHTGEQIQTDISQQQAAEAVAAYSPVRYQKAIYPVLYLEGEEYFTQVQQFLEAQNLAGATQAIEYAETDDALIISYYVRDAERALQNNLAVFDMEGTLHLHERLAGGLSGIGSDTFFIFMDELYFIKNKTILEVYRLLA